MATLKKLIENGTIQNSQWDNFEKSWSKNSKNSNLEYFDFFKIKIEKY